MTSFWRMSEYAFQFLQSDTATAVKHRACAIVSSCGRQRTVFLSHLTNERKYDNNFCNIWGMRRTFLWIVLYEIKNQWTVILLLLVIRKVVYIRFFRDALFLLFDVCETYAWPIKTSSKRYGFMRHIQPDPWVMSEIHVYVRQLRHGVTIETVQ